jgi:hypothetical protein
MWYFPSVPRNGNVGALIGWATTAVKASGTWIAGFPAPAGDEDAAAVAAVDRADELSPPQAEATRPATTTVPAASQRPERCRGRGARGARPLFGYVVEDIGDSLLSRWINGLV